MAVSWRRESWYAENLRLTKELFHLCVLEKIPPNALAALRADYDKDVGPNDKRGSFMFHECLRSLDAPGQATAGSLGCDIDRDSLPYPAWYVWLNGIAIALMVVFSQIAWPRYGTGSSLQIFPRGIAVAFAVMVVALVVNQLAKRRAARRPVYIQCSQCGGNIPAGADRCESCGARETERRK
jgi:hypothetical protein